jgi:hypothetical protein
MTVGIIRYEGPKVVAKDTAHQHSHDKLIRTEIATLIGLMVQRPIDVSLPEPNALGTYIERTEALLQELHLAMTKPWFEGWNASAGETPQTDRWGSAAAMREPIFYGGESAYSFQYRDFARAKYREDDGWLDANKGFRIDDACQIVEALGKLQSHRLIECQRSLRKRAPDKWTMLPAFVFTDEDVTLASGVAPEKVQHFLTAFSCDENERNSSFTGLSEINISLTSGRSFR